MVLQDVTNDAMSAVGTGVTVRIVKTIFLSAGYDVTPTIKALDDIGSSQQQFQKWRNEAGADLVVMITGKPPAGLPGGIAYVNSHESVVSIDYLSLYVFTHEIGHSFGCNHNREYSPQISHPYGHALQVPKKGFRTVMAYKCDDNDTYVRLYRIIARKDTHTKVLQWEIMHMIMHD